MWFGCVFGCGTDSLAVYWSLKFQNLLWERSRGISRVLHYKWLAELVWPRTERRSLTSLLIWAVGLTTLRAPHLSEYCFGICKSQPTYNPVNQYPSNSGGEDTRPSLALQSTLGAHILQHGAGGIRNWSGLVYKGCCWFDNMATTSQWQPALHNCTLWSAQYDIRCGVEPMRSAWCLLDEADIQRHDAGPGRAEATWGGYHSHVVVCMQPLLSVFLQHCLMCTKFLFSYINVLFLLEWMSPKWYYTYSFVIRSITWKLFPNNLLGKSHYCYIK